MLPNEIILTVDEANDNSTTPNITSIYRRFREHLGRTEYIHSTDHSADSRDKLDIYATEATPAGNFRGVRRASFKFTKDYEVLGKDGVSTITSPVIVEVKISAPVGVPLVDLIKEKQKADAFIDKDAVMSPLMALSET